jgi:hypothetical protein
MGNLSKMIFGVPKRFRTPAVPPRWGVPGQDTETKKELAESLTPWKE